MELFQRAKAVRLKSHHDKYLFADDDELRVTQDRDGSSPNARWAVEHVPVPSGDGDGAGAGGGGHRVFRLRSRYGKYLTASNEPFLLGMTGRKVLQTKPERLDSAVEWEPEREGFQVRLKTRYGHYLRANGGLPPWRNSVTHDVPHRTATQDWVLWDVEILEINVPSPSPAVVAAAPSSSPNPPPQAKLSKLESSDSFAIPLHKVDSRVIYYHIADDKGRVDDGIEGHSFIFNGTSLEELAHKLEEETGLSDIIVCSKSPLNGKLHPLRLQLPPNNAPMHIVLVRENSKVAKAFP